jgi:hypothetical protein
MTPTATLAECPNCGAPLDGAFCARCGQKASPLNPSFADLLHELIHEIAHVDGKIVHSVRLLLTKPGLLSLEQFEGRRVRYISPIRLYLVFSVLYFAVAAFAPMAGPRISCTTCSAEDRPRIEQEMHEAVTHWIPRTMFILVPAFAALVALFARRSGRNYPQHLYFSMHLHAAWFFIGAVAAAFAYGAGAAGARAASLAAGLWALLYFILSFRRAYRATVTRAVLTVAVTTFVYLVAVSIALLAIVLPVAARG